MEDRGSSKLMPKSIPGTIPWRDSFDVGIDAVTSVDGWDYQLPFRFTGKLIALRIELGEPELKSARRRSKGRAERRSKLPSRRFPTRPQTKSGPH